MIQIAATEGRPTSAAVLPLADQDGVYVGGVGWASTALGYESNQLPGASYSIQGANAVDYLVDAVFNYPTLAEGYKVAALDAVNKMRAISRVTGSAETHELGV